MKGLVIRTPWINMILAGTKSWEMRSKLTHIRGRIALIRAGSGLIVGSAELVDCLPALSLEQMRQTQGFHGIPDDQLASAFEANWTTPWVLRNVEVLATPKPYQHKSGAVKWVHVPDEDPQQSMSAPTQQATARAVSRSAVAKVVPAPTAKADAPRSSGTTSTWVDIPITGGNLRHHHFYLRTASALLPSDCIGGNNKQKPGKSICVSFQPGRVRDADIDGVKMILRARSETRDFFERSGAVEGDCVRFSRVGDRDFVVSLKRAAAPMPA